jgi:hypothetical protein
MYYVSKNHQMNYFQINNLQCTNYNFIVDLNQYSLYI